MNNIMLVNTVAIAGYLFGHKIVLAVLITASAVVIGFVRKIYVNVIKPPISYAKENFGHMPKEIGDRIIDMDDDEKKQRIGALGASMLTLYFIARFSMQSAIVYVFTMLSIALTVLTNRIFKTHEIAGWAYVKENMLPTKLVTKRSGFLGRKKKEVYIVDIEQLRAELKEDNLEEKKKETEKQEKRERKEREKQEKEEKKEREKQEKEEKKEREKQEKEEKKRRKAQEKEKKKQEKKGKRRRFSLFGKKKSKDDEQQDQSRYGTKVQEELRLSVLEAPPSPSAAPATKKNGIFSIFRRKKGKKAGNSGGVNTAQAPVHEYDSDASSHRHLLI